MGPRRAVSFPPGAWPSRATTPRILAPRTRRTAIVEDSSHVRHEGQALFRQQRGSDPGGWLDAGGAEEPSQPPQRPVERERFGPRLPEDAAHAEDSRPPLED